MPLNIPNLLTWFRIVMIPVFLAVFYLSDDTISLHNKHLYSTLIFIFAAITDWLDGYLARRLNQGSAFGAFLDPVADKLMVAAALIMLVGLRQVDAFIAVIIIGREIAISALREWMAQLGAGKNIAVSMLGKVKTTFQMIAIPFLLYQEPLFGLPTYQLGTLLIYLAALLTLWSMVYYLMLAMPQITQKSRE
ncbi:MAG: CDP-diacylglycerol--glycerol-3-phosphate 3-phosphatidyltransferase [Nitrosomonadales bacterium]|nr:CDP-diacylglycerol--glycerol-3-phosphate 3-phosphatidyltransferase [Nitrosomonadales bacterium]